MDDELELFSIKQDQILMKEEADERKTDRTTKRVLTITHDGLKENQHLLKLDQFKLQKETFRNYAKKAVKIREQIILRAK